MCVCVCVCIHKADIQECQTSKISKFVDHYLQPHINALPSYIKDTSDFINKISETENMTKDKFLVTLDVKSL